MIEATHHHVMSKQCDEAADFIANYCRKYARLGGQAKEKFGSVRFYASFGDLSLHGLLYPGYYWNPLHPILRTLDNYVVGPVLQFFFLNAFLRWQKFIYSRAYNKAIDKWPHLIKPLLCFADWPEYIKGATKVKTGETHVIDRSGSTLSIIKQVGN